METFNKKTCDGWHWFTFFANLSFGKAKPTLWICTEKNTPLQNNPKTSAALEEGKDHCVNPSKVFQNMSTASFSQRSTVFSGWGWNSLHCFTPKLSRNQTNLVKEFKVFKTSRQNTLEPNPNTNLPNQLVGIGAACQLVDRSGKVWYCWWKKSLAPVEVDSLCCNPLFTEFSASTGGCLGFFHQQYTRHSVAVFSLPI